MIQGKRKGIREIKREIEDIIGRNWTSFIFRVANYTSTDENIINTDLEINIYSMSDNEYINTVYCGISCSEEEDETTSAEEFWDIVELQRNALAKDKKYIYNALVKSYIKEVVELAEDYCQ